MAKRSEAQEESEGEEAAAEEESSPADADIPAWKAKLLQQLPFLAKFIGGAQAAETKAASSEDATDANIKVPAAAGPEEKRKKLIRVVVILGVLYLAFDTFMSSEEPAPEVAAVDTPKPARKKDRKKKVPVAEAPTTAGSEATTPPVTGDTPPSDVISTPETPLAEAPAAASDKPVDGVPALSEDGAIATTPQGSAVADPSLGNPETDASAPVEGVAGNPVDPEAAADAALNATDLGLPPAEGDIFSSGEEGAGDQVTETKTEGATGEGDMTEQILQDLEKQVATSKENVPADTSYIEPPDYENVGRGLVYNCQGKHWACVDGASYRICQQNFAALKSQSKPKECYTENVYQTDSNCSWVQRQKIIANTKTDFCL